MLISQLSVCHLWRCHGNHKFLVGLTKNEHFWHNSVFFPSFHQIAEIHELIHFMSILARLKLISVISRPSKKIVISKRADSKWRIQDGESNDVISNKKMLSTCRESSGLSNLRNFSSLFLNRTKTQAGQWGHQPPCPLSPPCCTAVGVWVILYFRGLSN